MSSAEIATAEYARIANAVTPPAPEQGWKVDALNFMVVVGTCPSFYGGQKYGVMEHLRECGLSYEKCTTPGEGKIFSFEGTEEEASETDAITAEVTCRCDRRSSEIAIPPSTIGQLLAMVDAWKTGQA
jgi:hypothetical protein